ncbi:4Fe-4S binding protein [Chloroflexota bacterium]
MKKTPKDPVLILVNRDKCGICGCCVPVCPPDAIVLHDAYLAVDNDTCTECMKCIPVCPTNALYDIPAEAILIPQGSV